MVTEQVKADFIFGTPTNMGPTVNSHSVECMVCISADGLEMYFVSDRPGGQGNGDIWVCTRQNMEDSWDSPMNLGPPVNSQYNEVYPSLSADGLRLYFSDLWSGFNSSPDRPGGLGGHDIWMSTRPSRTAPWTTPVNIGTPINTSQHELSPMIAGDDLTLFFASSRLGGPTYDLWISRRTNVQDSWGQPIRLDTNINTTAEEFDCCLAPDGLMFFVESDRPDGFGGGDLWMTKRKGSQDAWEQVINLGPVVNTSLDDSIGGISPDMRKLYFHSNRSGGFGSYDLWETQIIPVVDLNGDGIVDSADMCIVVDHWYTDNPQCDIGPTPWGDGIVDVQDLIVLAEHLFEESFSPELIACWKLDETAGDIAYNSIIDNHGVLGGNPAWQLDSGHADGALQFDGIDDYVQAGFVLDPADGAFSVFAWINGGATGQVIISQEDGTGSGETWLGITASDGSLMTGLVPPPVGRFRPEPLDSQSVVTDDQWHHIGFVWDGSYRCLYVDGIEVDRDTQAITAASLKHCDGGLYIGTSKTLDTGTFFSGLIDDVRIYNVALSAGKIAALAR
jgi:hypothetical protein